MVNKFDYQSFNHIHNMKHTTSGLLLNLDCERWGSLVEKIDLPNIVIKLTSRISWDKVVRP